MSQEKTEELQAIHDWIKNFGRCILPPPQGEDGEIVGSGHKEITYFFPVNQTNAAAYVKTLMQYKSIEELPVFKNAFADYKERWDVFINQLPINTFTGLLVREHRDSLYNTKEEIQAAYHLNWLTLFTHMIYTKHGYTLLANPAYVLSYKNIIDELFFLKYLWVSFAEAKHYLMSGVLKIENQVEFFNITKQQLDNLADMLPSPTTNPVNSVNNITGMEARDIKRRRQHVRAITTPAS